VNCAFCRAVVTSPLLGIFTYSIHSGPDSDVLGIISCLGPRKLACDDSHEREVEQRGDDISGLGVNIASRIEAVARPAEVLVYVSPRYQSSLRE